MTRAWMDEDGRHVWVSHNCAQGEQTTWLPSIWKETNGKVAPSFWCRLCGTHEFLTISPSEEAVA